MKTSLVTLLILVASVLALVLGPVVLVMMLGSGIGMTIGGAMLVLGAAGLWIGMKELERSRTGDPS